MLKVVYEYSLKWRLKFNLDKCNVVVFDNKNGKNIEVCNLRHHQCSCQNHYKFGNSYIKEVLVYKYLGIELDHRLSYKEFKQRILSKARSSMNRIQFIGKNYLSVKS